MGGGVLGDLSKHHNYRSCGVCRVALVSLWLRLAVSPSQHSSLLFGICPLLVSS